MKRQGMAFFFFNFLWLLSFIGFLFTHKASNDLLTPYAFIGFLFDRPCMVDAMGELERRCKGSAFIRIMRSAVLERSPDEGIS